MSTNHKGLVLLPGGGTNQAPRFDRRVLPALALIVSGDRHAQEDPVVANAWARGLERRFRGISKRYRVVVVIHGAQEGIDTIAAFLGMAMDFIALPLPYVEALGKAGGPVRNEAMLKAQQALAITGYDKLALLCHPDIEHGSKGTRNMRNLLADAFWQCPYEVYASPEEMGEEPGSGRDDRI